MKGLFMKAKAVALCILLFVCAVFSVGCRYEGYKGENPQLYTVAWNNIPVINGYIATAEVTYDAEVEILETDSYGRVLFTYSEDYWAFRSTYVLIMQRTDGAYVYYYPDDCYTFVELEEGENTPNLDSGEIVALKNANDWEQPLDTTKGEGATIIRKKLDKGKIKVSESLFEGIVREYHENSDRYIHPKNIRFVSYYEFMASDDYGRELYVVYTSFSEYAEKVEIRYSFPFLVVITPGKHYDPSTVILLENAQKPQEDMKRIKASNGWNTPLDAAVRV